MGISIDQYRSRIGNFLPKVQRIVQNRLSLINVFKLPKRYLVLFIALTAIVFIQSEDVKNKNYMKYVSKSSYSSTPACLICTQQVSIYHELSNFSARYLYGNIDSGKTKGIKIAHLNKGPGFLKTKLNDIENAISSFKPHILGVSEANLMHDHDENDIQLSDYSLVKCPTILNASLKYSRVVVYIQNSMVYKLRNDLMSSEYSSIWVQVGLPGQKQILVCHTYREWQELGQINRGNSSNSVQDQLQRWLIFLDQWERALRTGMEVIVCGDMNLNHLDWCLPSFQQSTQTRKLLPLIEELFQKIFSQGVIQCVTVATRFMSGQPQTGIDHLYTNQPEKLSSVSTTFWGGSDHKMIFAIRQSKSLKKGNRYVKKRQYKNFDCDTFLNEISKLIWWDVYMCEDLDTAVQLFTEKFTGVLDKLAPMKIFQSRVKYAPWLSTETKKLIDQRNVAQSKAAFSNDEVDWQVYRRLRNKVTSKLRIEKLNWQKDKMKETSKDSGKQWKNVLKWLNWKSASSPTQLRHNGKILNKPADIANYQNEFFIKKVATIKAGISPICTDPLGKLKCLMKNRQSTFKLKCVHPETVEKLVCNLKNSKSFGLDQIDTFAVKLAMPYILSVLTHIINLSILTSKFPSSWKTAKVIPLHKKGDFLDPKNFRPVAILPILSKLLERVVFLQIVDYMEQNNLIHPSHHGFRVGHSTTTGMIQMYDCWIESIESGNHSAACFLDLSAAFDVVDHPLLLEKLKLYGFSISSWEWMSSYLYGRSQSVYVDDFLSDPLPVTSGVPQGSILGPLMYIIFTNELPEIVHDHDPPAGNIFNTTCQSCGTVCCYADDSSFSISSPNIDDLNGLLSEKYKLISDFMSGNGLKLNSDKTHLMHFTTDRAGSVDIQLNTGNEMINASKSENLLGGIVSMNLRWDQHVMHDSNALIKQLSKRLSAIRQISHIADFKTRRMFANGLFLSKLAYLTPLWGGCQNRLINALQVMQNRAARYVAKRDIYTPVRTLLTNCGWLSVYQMVFFQTVVLFYKTRQKKVPAYLFNMASSDYSYSTREKAKGNYKVITAVRRPSSHAMKSYRWRSVDCWNMVPVEIKSIKYAVQFKKSLKVWISQNISINP